jgi:glycosyltransferase involved in cell wall biosynthesis
VRLLVDAVHLSARPKGVGLYVGNVVARLAALDPTVEITLLEIAGDGSAADFPLPGVHRQPVRWVNHLWHGFRTLPRAARHLRADVVLVPYEAPLAALPMPTAMVCHDLPAEIRRAQRDAGGARRSLAERTRDAVDDRLLGRSLRRAARVFCNSRYVADGLVQNFGVGGERLRAAPCAPAHDFAALARGVDREERRRRLGLPAGYVLAFFTGDERENLGGVLASFDRLAAAGRSEGLVIAGLSPSDRERVEATVAGRPWRERLRLFPFLGPGERDELAALYAAAMVYLDLSLHEGFGMQVVEAMACGTPVVCSDRGALPEVTGGAALLVDPARPDEVAADLAALLADAGRRRELAAKGAARAGEFTWEKTAAAILAGLREIAPTS